MADPDQPPLDSDLTPDNESVLRSVITMALIFVACLMAGVSWWKIPIVCLIIGFLHLLNFGARWLEKLTVVIVVAAAIYFVDVVSVDRIVSRGMTLIGFFS
jgi:hypothetical protein